VKPFESLLRLAAIAASIVAPLHAMPQDQAPLTEDQRALFALLDALDPLDTSTVPIVKCTIRIGDAAPVDVLGFLIEEDETHFVFRDVYLVRHDVARTFRSDAPHGSHTASTARALAEAAVRAMREGERPASGCFDPFDRFPHEDVVPLFVVARDQARRGNLAEVHRLWSLLPTQRVPSLRYHDGRAAILAPFFARRLREARVDPRVSWEQLLVMLAAYLAALPDDFDAREWREQHTKIAALLHEKKRRAAERGARPTADDLVFDLHDEVLDPNLPHRFPTDGPASKVVAAGLDAVPALIAALDDTEGLTRCMHAEQRMLSMANVAERLLVEIAGWRPEGEDRKSAWQRWLTEARAQGPDAVLEQRAVALDLAAVATHATRHPERLDRLLDAIRASADPRRRRDAIVALLRPLDRPLPDAVLQFLADEVGNDMAGRWQAEAANALGEQRRTDAVAVAAQGWLDRIRDPVREIDADDTAARAQFLLRHLDEAAATEALNAGCGDARGRRSLALALDGMAQERRAAIATSPASASFRALLRRLLDDESIVAVGKSVESGTTTVGLNTVAVADVAEATLASCWPAEFAFDPKPTASVRRQLRREPRQPQRQRDPALPANLVTSVTIHDSLLDLPEKSLAKLRALQGSELTDLALHDAVIWTDLGAKDRSIGIFVERTGLGDGTTIRVEPLERGTRFSRHEVDGRCWVVTANGEREATPQFPADDSSPIADVRQALQRPATTGVEITVIVGGR